MSNIRVGMGYDVHQLKHNLPFILGGVKLNYDKGIVAHSDGDIVLHAIADALLGAAGLGDIGHFFPDDNPKYYNMDSNLIIKEVLLKLKKLQYSIVNIDITVVLEKPKLVLLIPRIKESISKSLKINIEDINVKATTSEGMGLLETKMVLLVIQLY